jgi:outer membrane receptor for ferrienterochelin and colicin
VDGRCRPACPDPPRSTTTRFPPQFIERVDIYGWRSSVYGSDAVAGVVNIIYKKDFEGVAF